MDFRCFTKSILTELVVVCVVVARDKGLSYRQMEKTAKYAIESKRNLSSSSSNSNPLLKRIYHDRCTLIHKILTNLHHTLPIQQLLILGCGYDTSYSKFGSQVYAVDLPSVIHEVKTTIDSNLDSENKSPFYIPHDLRDITGLFSALTNTGFSISEHTVIIVEVVLCYMPEASSIEVLRVLSEQLPNSTVVILDPLIMDTSTKDTKLSSVDGFTTQLSQGFKQWGHAHPRNQLISVPTYVDLFCNQLHWRYFSCSLLVEALQTMLTSEERIGSVTGVFDEFAALSLLRQRYLVVIASQFVEVSVAFPSTLFTDKEALIFATDNSQNLGYTMCSVPIENASINSGDTNNYRIERYDVHSHGPETIMTEIASLIEIVSYFKIRHITIANLFVFSQSFQELKATHSAIRKYVKNSIKSLQQCLKPGARISTHDATEMNTTIPKIILFCVWEVESGQLIGFVALRSQIQSLSTDLGATALRGEVTSMCVLPTHRRKGIAAALLKEVNSCYYE